MPFALLDTANIFYIKLQEGLPTSITDVATSRITIPNFINILTDVIRSLNEISPYVQHAVIAVTSGTRQYTLPTDFIYETSVRYRGWPLNKTTTADKTFLIATTTNYPWQYDILAPGTSSSALAVTGNYYLIIDPTPSETSPVGTPPIFPGPSDPFIMVTYKARIPTDFTTSNYTTYTFELPEEFAPVLADLCVSYVMGLEQKTSIFQQNLLVATQKIKSISRTVATTAELNPGQSLNQWWDN